MAITTPDAVPGEVIEAAWGDAVKTDLTALDAGKVAKAGDTMTGGLTVPAFTLNGSGSVTGLIGAATAPTSNSHLANKGYVDGRDNLQVTKTGDTMSGNLTLGDPNAAGSTAGISLLATGGITTVKPPTAVTTDPSMIFARVGSPGAGTGAQYARFDRGTSNVGTITIASATSVAYNTTSDPRSKTPPPLTRGISDAMARVQAIGRNAWQGHHIDPDSGDAEAGDLWDFVSSHDVEDHAPYAVYGERDGEEFQQVSYGDLVPLLFAALASALDRIDVLEAASA